jgi:hypothetical protein
MPHPRFQGHRTAAGIRKALGSARESIRVSLGLSSRKHGALELIVIEKYKIQVGNRGTIQNE